MLFYCNDPDIYQVSKGDLVIDFKNQIAETDNDREIQFLRSLKYVSEQENIKSVENNVMKGKRNDTKFNSKAFKSK